MFFSKLQSNKFLLLQRALRNAQTKAINSTCLDSNDFSTFTGSPRLSPLGAYYSFGFLYGDLFEG